MLVACCFEVSRTAMEPLHKMEVRALLDRLRSALLADGKKLIVSEWFHGLGTFTDMLREAEIPLMGANTFEVDPKLRELYEVKKLHFGSSGYEDVRGDILEANLDDLADVCSAIPGTFLVKSMTGLHGRSDGRTDGRTDRFTEGKIIQHLLV